MAAEDYVEKLPTQFSEFAEAVNYSKDKNHFIGQFSSATDLMQQTPIFWEQYVMPKLDREFRGLHRFLNEPYPDGPNPYLQKIQVNMERLKRGVATGASERSVRCP
jgi:hypothetical protein